MDIFGNDIFDTSDDGLELDFGQANVSVWGNRIHNAVHNGISFQPQDGGPWYIIRNQIVGSVESPFKFRTTDRFVLIQQHDRQLASPGRDDLLQRRTICWAAIPAQQSMDLRAGRTDLVALMASRTTGAPISTTTASTGVTRRIRSSMRALVDDDLPSFSRASGLESHGVRIFKDACFSDFRVPGPTPTRIPPHLMSLRPDCNAVDAGAILPNLSDPLRGGAPDLGAHEYGQPARSDWSEYLPVHRHLTRHLPRPSRPAIEPVYVPPPTGSPSPWPSQDIGAVAISGSTSESSGVWTISGAGSDIWGSADSFHFVHQPMTGDGIWTARLTTLTNTHSWTKAGVMMRADLAPDSPHAFVFATPGVNGAAFQRRVQRGARRFTPAVALRICRNGCVLFE